MGKGNHVKQYSTAPMIIWKSENEFVKNLTLGKDI